LAAVRRVAKATALPGSRRWQAREMGNESGRSSDVAKENEVENVTGGGRWASRGRRGGWEMGCGD
jgi:hypothetical protein